MTNSDNTNNFYKICLFEEAKDSLKSITDKIITNTLKDKRYQESDCEYFIENINNDLLKEYLKMSNNFKYIINLTLFKTSESGITNVINCYFNNDTDGYYQKKYEFENIGCLACIIVVAL